MNFIVKCTSETWHIIFIVLVHDGSFGKFLMSPFCILFQSYHTMYCCKSVASVLCAILYLSVFRLHVLEVLFPLLRFVNNLSESLSYSLVEMIICDFTNTCTCILQQFEIFPKNTLHINFGGKNVDEHCRYFNQYFYILWSD